MQNVAVLHLLMCYSQYLFFVSLFPTPSFTSSASNPSHLNQYYSFHGQVIGSETAAFTTTANIPIYNFHCCCFRTAVVFLIFSQQLFINPTTAASIYFGICFCTIFYFIIRTCSKSIMVVYYLSPWSQSIHSGAIQR